MANPLILLCSAERIPSWDEGNNLAFGLNLSVAIDDRWDGTAAGATARKPQILKPWAWPAIDKIRVFRLDANGRRLRDSNGADLPAIDADVLFGLTPARRRAIGNALNAGLENKYGESSGDDRNLLWQISPDRIQKLGPSSKPWHTLVGKLSTYPFPVPQALNLSFFFRATLDRDAVKQVFAAPVLKASGTAAFPASPASPVAPASGSDIRIQTCPYDGATDIAVEAHSAPCVVDSPVQGTFLNPVTQWVGNPGNNNHFDEDWLSLLEGRLADVLDLSRELIEFLKDPAMAPVLAADDNLRQTAEMAIAALADIVGPGWQEGPEGGNLMSLLLGDAGAPPLTNDDVQKLNGTSLYADIKEQRSVLRAVLGPAVDYALLRDEPPRIAIEQTIAELEAIRGSVLSAGKDRLVIPILASAQWKLWFDRANIANKEARLQALTAAAAKYPDLRRALSMSNLGRYWDDFLKCLTAPDSTGRDLVAKGVPAFFQFYMAQRFGLPVPMVAGVQAPARPVDFSPGVRVVPSTLAAALLAHAAARGKIAADSVVLPAAPTQPNETPHPITLQVDQLAAIPDETAGFTDLLNRFSGVAFLMKDSTAANWQCLNYAELGAGGNALEAGSPPALIPYRITYRNNLRQVCASYDNQPLIADSPLSHDEMVGWVNGPETAQFAVLLNLGYSTNAVAKMPRLTYGRKYEFAVFAITNCGTIPRKVADSSPYVLKAGLPRNADAAAVIRSVTYQRRVRIGALRIHDRDDASQPLTTAAIPDDVQPLARDIAVLATRELTWAAATAPPAPGAAARHEQMPLILLSPDGWKGTKAVSGGIHLPGVHWDCWNRWLEDGSGAGKINADARAAVIADFFRQAKSNSELPKGSTGPSLAVDDPALERWLYFELLECKSDGNLAPLAARTREWIPIPGPGAGDTGLNSQRAKAAPFVCEWTDQAAQQGVTLEAGVVRIRILRGKIYRLGIFAVLSQAGKARFADGILDLATPVFDNAGHAVTNATALPNPRDGGNSYYVVSPQFFALEAATEELPNGDSVYAGMTLGTAANQPGQIEVNMAAISPSVARVDLRRQVWRWQGRNTRMHPSLVSATPARADLDDWEAVEFGDRDDSDSTAAQMLPTPTAGGARKFRYTETLQTSKGDFDLRSLHFRFAATAYSRYKGLMPPSVQYSAGAAWKPVFVPCRRLDEVPTPKVRLILPLTETGSSGWKTPGLLVVFDGPWHESGGLSERLQARVAFTADPSETPANLSHYYYETGPDPIVSNHIPELLKTPKAPSTDAGRNAVTIPERFLTMLGPVGHYFGGDNSNALFVATSFIIPSPRLAGEDEKKTDLRWFFAKLQFRRMLVTKAKDVTPSKEPGKAAPPKQYELVDGAASPYTEPMWAQYLPPFSIFEDTSFTPDRLRIRLTTNGTNGPVIQFSLLTAASQPFVLKPMDSGKASFKLHAVLTRRVFDVTGRPDQEQYLGIFDQDAANNWKLADPKPEAMGKTSSEFGYRVRILEVQRPPNSAGGGATLWQDLFGTPGGGAADSARWNTEGDARARIVRISEPIDVGRTTVDTCEGN